MKQDPESSFFFFHCALPISSYNSSLHHQTLTLHETYTNNKLSPLLISSTSLFGNYDFTPDFLLGQDNRENYDYYKEREREGERDRESEKNKTTEENPKNPGTVTIGEIK